MTKKMAVAMATSESTKGMQPKVARKAATFFLCRARRPSFRIVKLAQHSGTNLYARWYVPSLIFGVMPTSHEAGPVEVIGDEYAARMQVIEMAWTMICDADEAASAVAMAKSEAASVKA